MLLAVAFANGWAEEVIVVAFFMTRLRQLGMSPVNVLVVSSLLRGAYHLYQGFGAGVGNIVMGLVFGYVWQRTGRLWPLIIAHGLIDAVAFVGLRAARRSPRLAALTQDVSARTFIAVNDNRPPVPRAGPAGDRARDAARAVTGHPPRPELPRRRLRRAAARTRPNRSPLSAPPSRPRRHRHPPPPPRHRPPATAAANAGLRHRRSAGRPPPPAAPPSVRTAAGDGVTGGRILLAILLRRRRGGRRHRRLDRQHRCTASRR